MSLDLRLCFPLETASLVDLAAKSDLPFDAVLSLEYPETDTRPALHAARLAQDAASPWHQNQLVLSIPHQAAEKELRAVFREAIAFAKRKHPGNTPRLLISGIDTHATALWLMIKVGQGNANPQSAFNELMTIRPSAKPDANLLRHGDAYLQLSDSLIDAVETGTAARTRPIMPSRRRPTSTAFIRATL